MTRWILAVATLIVAGHARAGSRDPLPIPAPDHADEAQTLDAPPHARPRVWLGVFIEDATDGGIQVVDVVPGGPAADAGLARGDVLIRANGADLVNLADLRRAIGRSAPGDALSLTALRAGASRIARLILAMPPPPGWSLPKAPVPPTPPGRPPAAAPSPPGRLEPGAVLGLSVEAIPSELRTHLGGPPGAGVLVTRVDPMGACSGRIKVGDLIVKVNDSPLTTVDFLAAQILRGGTLRVDGVRAGRPYAADVEVAAPPLEDDSRRRRIRALEASIRQLEASLQAMRRELAALQAAP